MGRMKLALDHKKLHLRFIFGTGIILFIVTKIIKRENPETAKTVKSLGRDIRKILKNYKRAYGTLKLVEIESADTRICIKL